MMLLLTDWNSALPVVIDSDAIRCMSRIEASVSELSGSLREYGERTRIDVDNNCYLVRETPEQIIAACNMPIVVVADVKAGA